MKSFAYVEPDDGPVRNSLDPIDRTYRRAPEQDFGPNNQTIDVCHHHRDFSAVRRQSDPDAERAHVADTERDHRPEGNKRQHVSGSHGAAL